MPPINMPEGPAGTSRGRSLAWFWCDICQQWRAVLPMKGRQTCSDDCARRLRRWQEQQHRPKCLRPACRQLRKSKRVTCGDPRCVSWARLEQQRRSMTRQALQRGELPPWR